MGGTRAALSPTRPPAAKPSVPCQGLSKLQELVRYHIYDHGQVRVFLPDGGQLAPEAGLSGVCVWAPAFPGALLLSLPIWTTRPQSIITGKDPKCVAPRCVASAQPKATLSSAPADR